MYPSKYKKVGQHRSATETHFEWCFTGRSMVGPTLFAGWDVSTLCFCILSRKLLGSNLGSMTSFAP